MLLRPNNLANLLSRLKQLDEVPRGVEQANLRTTRRGYYIITTKLYAGRADFGMKFSSKKVTDQSSKINAEVKDPVVLVLWVSVANGELVAHSQGPR
jgi:hypothetical protein